MLECISWGLETLLNCMSFGKMVIYVSPFSLYQVNKNATNTLFRSTVELPNQITLVPYVYPCFPFPLLLPVTQF